jgi:hypothetical protein
MKANEKFIALVELESKILLMNDFVNNGETLPAIQLLQDLVLEYSPQ